MNRPALRVAPVLRVTIIAADPQRRAQLAQQVHNLGHIVAPDAENATVILSAGAAPGGLLPTVSLGADDEGHAGRLPPDASAGQIDAALRAVAVGLSVMPAKEARSGFDAVPEIDERTLLTPRETEVLACVSDGLTNKQIARALGISQHTVKFHLESLMRKLAVSSRAEAVSKSIGLRLLQPHRL